jgi:hypothetical protein
MAIASGCTVDLGATPTSNVYGGLTNNGTMTVDTELKRGTRFTLALPRLLPETLARLEGAAPEVCLSVR